MDRRRFLQAAAVGAAGLGLPTAAWSLASGAAPLHLAEPELLYILRDPQKIQAIGAAYRAATPRERDAEALESAIAASLGVSGRTFESALGARLQQQVRGDFAAGRTVVVSGWVLSVTEARQCALYSLQFS